MFSRNLAGGNLCSNAAIFTADSKYFFTTLLSTVRMHSVSTSDVVREFSIIQDNTNTSAVVVVGMHLNPKNQFQLIVCGSDGAVQLWDYEDGVLLKAWKLNDCLLQTRIDPLHCSFDAIHIYAVTCKLSDKVGKQVKHFTCLMNENNITEPTTVFQSKEIAGFDLSEDGKSCAIYAGKQLTIIRDMECPEPQTIQHQKQLTTLAYAPQSFGENCVATGDVWGQIFLWHINNQTQTTTTKLHWHAHPVRSLCFSPDGSHLYSGGEEAVLVVWQLKVGFKKHFLPRLGGAVLQLAASANQNLLSACLSDNSVYLISPFDFNLRIGPPVRGIKYASCANEHDKQSVSGMLPLMNTGGLCRRPGSSELTMLGAPWSLQSWECRMNRSVGELDVIPRPRLHRNEEGFQRMGNIQLFAYSPCGQWLATVDTSHLEEQSLKLWLRQSDGRFKLNVRISQPHSAPVNQLIFRPDATNYQLLTCSQDKSFKLWQIDSSSASLIWRLKATGSWHNSEPRAAAYSPDGSVLAIAFGSVVTLWDPNWLTIVHTLPVLQCQSIDCMMFTSTQSLLCVSRQESLCQLWDVFRGRLQWKLAAKVKFCCQSFRKFAIILNARKHAESGNAILLFDNTTSDSCNATALHFIPGTVIGVDFCDDNQLAVLDGQCRLQLLSTSEVITKDVAQPVTMETPRGLFSSLFGQDTTNNASNEQLMLLSSTIQQKELALFEAPSHILPSGSKFFQLFMDNLMSANDVCVDEDTAVHSTGAREVLESDSDSEGEANVLSEETEMKGKVSDNYSISRFFALEAK